jgi:hypothetical protein
MGAAIPFALMAASSGADAQSSQATRAGAVPGSKPPLFPDNAQFWYKTLRGFGAANYGGSEFGDGFRPLLP